MADVVVSMPAGGAANLPPVCVGCGRTGTRGRRVRVLGESSGYARMAGEYAIDHLERMARGPGVIRLPVCWWHRWVAPPRVTATAAAGSTVALAGVSPEFAAAAGERPPNPRPHRTGPAGGD